MKTIKKSAFFFSVLSGLSIHLHAGELYQATSSGASLSAADSIPVQTLKIDAYMPVMANHPDSLNNPELKYVSAKARLKSQAESIKAFAKANDYSMEYCFLIDMSIPSGKKRFFVYNLRKDSIEYAGLVSHGFGSDKKDQTDELTFSNKPFSFKTSIGKYKIGNAYKGTFGLSYKLHGLDSTNSKALERAIVLHGDAHVPEQETYPVKIFQSAGCPTVTPGFLNILGSYIKSSKKPILMWIYS